MEFGKVNEAELDSLNLKLPAVHAQTNKILAASKAKKTEMYVGCAKWGRPDWVGKIYPKGTKAANFLDEYAKQFNCIEFNAIFYKLPDKAQVKTWKSKVGRDFKFCPKFTEVITHRKRLKNVQADVDAFLTVLDELGENRGPVFLMPHPQMGPKQLETLQAFMESLPKDIDLFLEFRHPDWYLPQHADTIFNLMQQMKAGSIITDSAGRRDCVHMRLSTPDAFVRFVGNSLHPTDYTRIDDWVKQIKKWSESGLKRCYFFMHQHEELYSPELSKYLIEQLNKKAGFDIKVPQFV